jgi:hypothetical protein
MIFTRLGYFLILSIIAAAVVAIVIVLQPDTARNHPPIETEEVVNYARFGAIEHIEVDGRLLTVTFREDFDTEEHFGTDSRVFHATLAEGEEIGAMLTAAGVNIGGDGVQLTSQQ